MQVLPRKWRRPHRHYIHFCWKKQVWVILGWTMSSHRSTCTWRLVHPILLLYLKLAKAWMFIFFLKIINCFILTLWSGKQFREDPKDDALCQQGPLSIAMAYGKLNRSTPHAHFMCPTCPLPPWHFKATYLQRCVGGVRSPWSDPTGTLCFFGDCGMRWEIF